MVLVPKQRKPPRDVRAEIRTYKGIGVSPGIAIGRALIVEKVTSVFRVPIKDEDVPREIERFRQALLQPSKDLGELTTKVSRSAVRLS